MQEQQQQEPPVVDPRSHQCAPRQDGGRNCGYYWQDTGNPDYEYGENAAGEFDGVFKRYHRNGQLRELSYYRNGKQEGEMRTFYESGQLQTSRFYQNDEEHGPYKGWHENGNPMFTATNCQGRPCAPELQYGEQGRLKARKEFGADGGFKRYLNLDEQGRPHGEEIVGLYRNGEPVTDDNGYTMTDYTVQWKRGVKDGDEIHYKDRPKSGEQRVDYVIKWKDGQQVSR